MCDSVCLRFFFFFCVLQHVSVSRRGAPLQPKRLTYPQADPPHFERARAAARRWRERVVMRGHVTIFLNVAS